jgi:hypothetical protein
MKTLQEFKDEVLSYFDDNMRTYCPLCYGALAILNSHKCNEGWEMYYKAENLSYEQKVKACVGALRAKKFSKRRGFLEKAHFFYGPEWDKDE